MAFFHVTSKFFAIALLTSIKGSWAAFYLCGDMAVYLTYKTVRSDLRYWVDAPPILSILATIVSRPVVKMLVSKHISSSPKAPHKPQPRHQNLLTQPPSLPLPSSPFPGFPFFLSSSPFLFAGRLHLRCATQAPPRDGWLLLMPEPSPEPGVLLRRCETLRRQCR